MGDAVPLGPAAGAGGRRRLAGARHRVPVRRLRRCWSSTRSSDRVDDLDHAERAVVLGHARLRVRRARAGPAETSAAASHAVHHLLLGHGLATQRMRAAAAAPGRHRHHAQPGTADPATDSAADLEAARRADGLGPRIYLDPLVHGRYPADVVADLAARGRRASRSQDGDLAIISAPIDVLGRELLLQPDVHPGSTRTAGPRTTPASRSAGSIPPDMPRTAMDWEIVPEGFTDLLVRLAPRLPRPADGHHRERRRLRRPAGRRPASSPTTTAPPTSTAHLAAVAAARAARAPTSAATSPGP